MKLKKSLIALCAAGMIAGTAHAGVITFQFNPTGAGTGTGLIPAATILDEAPGNALGLNAVNSGSPLVVGTTITDLYQANLSVVKNGALNVFSNGSGGNFFTFVSSFNETVTSSSSNLDGSVTNNFSLGSGGFFKICAQTAVGNDLAGTGFACSGNGILSGHISSGNATQTGFPTSLTQLDGFDSPDQYPSIQTVTSSGSANLNLVIDSVDAGYFPDLLVGGFITTSFTNSSLITPFNQVSPSALFSSNGVANGDTAHNVGSINGISGPNFQFQADANSSFARTVPEPGTLSLLGLAVVGLGLLSRRRKGRVV